jgi:hypothetical protein
MVGEELFAQRRKNLSTDRCLSAGAEVQRFIGAPHLLLTAAMRKALSR